MSDLAKFIRTQLCPSPGASAAGTSGRNSNKPLVEEAFGHVSFCGQSEIDNFFSAKYVRFDPGPSPNYQAVYDLLFGQWHFSQPRLIISVAGGARRFVTRNHVVYEFNRSLIRAAASADALIITNGLWKGVCRLMGEAAQSFRYQEGATKPTRVQLLGITSWGVLQESDSLLNKNPAAYLDMKSYKVYDNNENEKIPASLDPNHHAFLLVDNGSHMKYGEELKFRAELENFILEKEVGGDGQKVPAVLLVIEGGETTLKVTLEFLRKGRPAVVVDGLGGCGDLIAFAYRKTEGMAGKPNNSNTDFVGFDLEMIAKCPHWKRYLAFKDEKAEDKMHEANVLLFEACVGKKRDLITVVNLADPDNLDSAILEANFKAASKETEPIDLLGLAIQWNRTDIADRYVFTSDSMANLRFFQLLEGHYEYFVMAFKRNYYQSVAMLLEHGFNVAGSYLTPDELCRMYSDVLSTAGKETQFVDEALRTVLGNLASSNGSDSRNGNNGPWADASYLLKVLGEIIDDLIPGHFSNIYDRPEYKLSVTVDEPHENGISDSETLRKRTVATTTTVNINNSDSNLNVPAAANGEVKKQADPVLYPQRDLFIFCVLLNRRQMALLMWRQLNKGGALAAALFAATVLRGLAAKSGSMVELAQSLRQHSEFWQGTASNFAEHCFERHQANAQLLLIRAVPELGNKTPFEFAHAGELQKFMSTSCCYTKLNANWRGQMSAATSVIQIVATTFCPLFLPAIKFRRSWDADLIEYHGSKVDPHEVNQRITAPTALRRVALYCSERHIDILQALYKFYTAPVTKYITNAFNYVVYLLLYSLFVLTDDFSTTAITRLEIIIWLWTIVMILEEGHEIAMSNGSLRVRLELFWSNWWHRVDLTAYLLFLAAAICHITLVGIHYLDQKPEDSVTETKQFKSSPLAVAVLDLYDLALLLFFLRLLSFFYVSQVLGPKVIALFRMILDVGFFIAIYLVILLAFSVPIQSLLFPRSPLTWNILEFIAYDFFLILFGMYNPEPKVRGRFDQFTCIGFNVSNPDTYNENLNISQRCPEVNYLAVVLLCVYLVLTSIVLINLLIAMFSFTFGNVEDLSTVVWRFNMYEFILAYNNRSPLAPPLSVIAHVISLASWLVKRILAYVNHVTVFNNRHNTQFVMYDDITSYSSVLQRRKAYQMNVLLRFETSSIETFFENGHLETEIQKQNKKGGTTAGNGGTDGQNDE